MPRRTVSIPTGIDKAIRELQATLLRLRNENTTYTEALVIVLLHGLLQPGTRETIAYWKYGNPRASKEDYKAIVEGYDPGRIAFEGLIDQLPTTDGE